MTPRTITVKVNLDALDRVITIRGGKCLCDFTKECPCKELAELSQDGQSCTCGVFTKVG